MTDKPKYPRAAAIEVARELCAALTSASERLIVAGSLRRLKKEVGDVELLYIPRPLEVKEDLFEVTQRSAVEEILGQLLARGILERRRNVNGCEMWGPKNKLARHVGTGIPVDLFAATRENWWNYLVCRTGSAQNNVRIASAAQARGWQWNPYGAGFTPVDPRRVQAEEAMLMKSEREVFKFVSLPYLEPHQR